MKVEKYRQILEKNTQIYNLTKICPVRAEVLHADRQTDRETDRQTKMTKLKMDV
jgi:hypothetical protein